MTQNEKYGYGVVNGIIGYSYIYPTILIVICAIIDARFIMNSALVLTTISLLIALGIFFLIDKPKNYLKEFGKFKVKYILYTILGFISIIGFQFLYQFILLLFGINITGGNANQQAVNESVISCVPLAFLAFSLIAPLVEELTYRYSLYNFVLKYKPNLAILISSIAFGAAHSISALLTPGTDILYELISLPPYIFSGFIFAFSYAKSKSLWIPLSIHALNNFMAVILTLVL